MESPSRKKIGQLAYASLTAARRSKTQCFLAVAASLHRIRKESLYLDMGFPTWNAFLKSKRISKWFFSSHISIHEHLVLKLGLSDRDLRPIGFAKSYLLSQLASRGILMTGNKTEWLEAARNYPLRRFKKHAWVEKMKLLEAESDPFPDLPKTPVPEPKPARRGFTVYLEPGEKAILDEALGKAGSMAQRVGAQLQLIALTFLASHTDTARRHDWLKFALSLLEKSWNVSISARDSAGREIYSTQNPK